MSSCPSAYRPPEITCSENCVTAVVLNSQYCSGNGGSLFLWSDGTHLHSVTPPEDHGPDSSPIKPSNLIEDVSNKLGQCLLYTDICTNKYSTVTLKVLRHVSVLIHHLRGVYSCVS